MTLSQLLDRACEEFADRPLFIGEDRTLTYVDVQRWSRRIAAGLVAAGVTAGEHVALIMANRPEYVAVKFAIARVGATCVPINYLFRAQEVGYILEQSDAVALVTTDRHGDVDHLASLDALVPGWEGGCAVGAIGSLRQAVVFSPTGAVRPGATTLADLEAMATPASTDRLAEREASGDPASYSDILYTSGTTGNPKGVLLKHDQVVREAYAAAYQRALEDGRRIGFPMPMYHVFGYIECLLAAMFVGGAVVPQVVFDAGAMLHAVARHGVNEIVGVPAVTLPLLERAAAGDHDLRSVHTVFSSGAAAPATIWDDIRATFGDVELVTGYGMTETTASTTCTNPEDDRRLLVDSNGRLRDGGIAGDPELGGRVATYKAVDPETGADLAPGQVGHLLVRGVVVTDGYYRKPDETKLAFTDDGWLRTGDLGTISADGILCLAGRLKESLRVGGELVMPREVEVAVCEHPKVAEAHVTGVPHPRLGEVVCVWVVPVDPEDAPDADAVIAHCQTRLARFKVPRHVIPIRRDDLPVTATGRVQKFRLAEMAASKLGLDG